MTAETPTYEWNLDPKYLYSAHIKSVYDGDTVTAHINLGLGVVLTDQKIRLLGIDTPEMRGDERPEGIKSRDYLRSLVLNKMVDLYTHRDKRGRYGRILGVIVVKKEDGTDLNCNQALLSGGYADLYGK